MLGAAGAFVGAGAAIVTSGCSNGNSATAGAPSPPGNLTADGLVDPIGLSPDDVFFAWAVRDGRRGAMQSAYRIVVGRPDQLRSGPGNPATQVWDSGRVPSPQQAFVAYSGPKLASETLYQWAVQTWDAQGGASRLSRPRTFETTLGAGDWKAKWITRSSNGDSRPDLYTYARREVRLTSSRIVRARAYVASDQQYELRVNGARAGRGQAYCFPDSQYFETLDLTSMLLSGSPNAFALLTTWQGATKGHPAGEPGVIMQVSVLHADGSREVITTDGRWRVLPGAWLPGTQRDLEGDLVDFTENIDGPAIPVGWDSPAFDDSSWAPAKVLGPAGTSPWTHLVPVRTRVVEEPVEPLSLTTLRSGAVVADFGKVCAAVPTVQFHNGVSGKVVAMRAGYLLDVGAGAPGAQEGGVSTQHGTQHTDMSYSYVQRGGSEEFHPFDYLGFRYFQIDDPGEPMSPDQLVALTRHAAVPNENAATFRSSNPTVDAIFELGRHSSLFTAQEQFIDTPTREKGPWLWDGFNVSQTAMAAFGEQNLTRKSLLEFAQSQHRFWPNGAVNKIYPTGLGALDINEYSEIYPEWVWEYWMHTGDLSLLERVYPVLERLSSYVYASVDRSSGLVTDLPATNVYYDFPVVTRLNVLGANVFRRTGQVAEVLNRPRGEVSRQRARQGRLTEAINKRLVLPDGVYVDGLAADGTPVAQSSQDTNACAIVYGVAPSDHFAAIAGYIALLGMQAPPRTATEVLEALGLAGLGADLLRILTDPAIEGWARILAMGGTFTWEVWEPSDANGDSMSHGWGSNVLVAIQHWLLGARPTAPGGSSFDISPPPPGLTSAGAVPTVRGPLELAWERPDSTGSSTISLDLTVPPNCTTTVSFPALHESDITEGGRPLAGLEGVRLRGIEGGVATLEVGSGHFRFSGLSHRL